MKTIDARIETVVSAWTIESQRREIFLSSLSSYEKGVADLKGANFPNLVLKFKPSLQTHLTQDLEAQQHFLELGKQVRIRYCITI